MQGQLPHVHGKVGVGDEPHNRGGGQDFGRLFLHDEIDGVGAVVGGPDFHHHPMEGSLETPWILGITSPKNISL